MELVEGNMEPRSGEDTKTEGEKLERGTYIIPNHSVLMENNLIIAFICVLIEIELN